MPKQEVVEVGADRKIKLTSKPVYGEWLYDEGKQKAWYCLPKLYTRLGLSGGGLGLVVDERFSKPMNPYLDYEKEELAELTNLNKKAAQSLTITMGKAEKEGTQHIIAWGVVAVVSAIVLVVVILALLVASGRMGQ